MFLADNRAVWRCDQSSCTVTHQGFHGNTTGRSNQSQRCHCSLSVWKQVTRICTHTHTCSRQRCLILSLSLSPKYQSCSVFIRSGWKHLWVWRHRLHSWHCCLLHTVNGYIFLCSCLPPRWASSSSGLRFIGGPQGQSSLWLADQTMTRTISITTCPGELLKCLTTTGVWQSGSCLTKCLTVNLASQYLFSHRTTRATKLPVLPSLNPGSETNY